RFTLGFRRQFARALFASALHKKKNENSPKGIRTFASYSINTNSCLGGRHETNCDHSSAGAPSANSFSVQVSDGPRSRPSARLKKIHSSVAARSDAGRCGHGAGCVLVVRCGGDERNQRGYARAKHSVASWLERRFPRGGATVSEA